MFRIGDTVIFDPDSFNPDYWNNLSKEDKIKYYGRYVHVNPRRKFENMKPKLFTFICEHHPQHGHCVLMDMATGELIPMCHPSNWRLAEDEEC